MEEYRSIQHAKYLMTKENENIEYYKFILSNLDYDDEIIVYIYTNKLIEKIQTFFRNYRLSDKQCDNLEDIYGHNILPYKIHGGKFFINIPNSSEEIIEDNDLLAIEVYVSNGDGTTIISPHHSSTHYMIHKKEYLKKVPIFKIKKSKLLFNIIKDNFRTLPFCPRFIYSNSNSELIDFNDSITEFFNMGLISSHPTLIETNIKSKVAQFEHTIFVTENNVEILS